MPPTKKTPSQLLLLFKKRLCALRNTRLKCSQEDLGKMIGKDQSTVHDWENETKLASPRVQEFVRLCELFGVSTEYLSGRSDLEHGLWPDGYIVDETAEKALRENPQVRLKAPVLFKLPRRLRIVDHDEGLRLRKELRLDKVERGRHDEQRG